MIRRFKQRVFKYLFLGAIVLMPSMLMAASDNTLTQSAIVEAKGHSFSVQDANQLRIHLKDPIEYKNKPIYFYVNVQEADWLNEMNQFTSTQFPGATFKKITDTKLEVSITNSIPSGVYYIPILTKITGGEATVSIDGAGTLVSDMSKTAFAVTSEQKARITAGEVVGVREEGVVASIKIDEIIRGSLVESSRADQRALTLTLLNTNYEFENAQPKIMPSRGFNDLTGISTTYAPVGSQLDKGVIRIQLPQNSSISTQGSLLISDLKVKTKSNTFDSGELKIRVSGSQIQDQVLTVAVIKDYSVEVKNKLSSTVQIKEGSKEDISFSIKESVLGSISSGTTMRVTLDKGYFSPNQRASITDLKVGSIKMNQQDVAKQVQLNAILKDNLLVGFSFTIPTVDPKKLNEIEFNDVSVYAPNGLEGDARLLVESFYLKDTASVVIAKINKVSDLTVEPLRLKVGVKDQKGGRLVISETDGDMIRRGDIEIEIEIEEGIYFTDEPQVSVLSGDIKLGTIRYDGVKPNVLKIQVLRSSTKASQIEIKNFVVTTDGTVPDGAYDLELKGSAIAPDIEAGAIVYKGFMIVGDVALPPVSNVPVGDKVAKFVVNSATYSVDGESRQMDAKAYIESGRTMVPVRYVADAIGIQSKDIHFENGIVTITTPQDIVVLYVGDSKAEVNGKQLQMSGQVILKDSRTYVPVAEVARILGIKVNWNAQTKTAVFEQ